MAVRTISLPNGFSTVTGVDVSHLVAFETIGDAISLDSSVTPPVVSGVSLGSGVVTLSGTATSVNHATISVVNPVVTITTLHVVLVTDVEWVSPAGLPIVQPWSAAMTPTVRMVQMLTAEGDSGTVEATAVFSDGYTYLIPAEQLLVDASASESVVASGSTVTVPSGAPYECGKDLVEVGWALPNCNNLSLASGFPPILVNMPNAVALTLTIAAPRLTDPTDSAAVAPISIPEIGRAHV